MHRLCRRQNRLFYLNTFSRSLFSMSSASKDRILSRDVVVTQIPSGDKHTLFAGAKVFIHQVLGGTYTVQGDAGLYRIDGKDADSIGERVNVETVSAATTADGAPDPTALWDQLRKVYDPEIPVNIVDLGLVYSLDVIKADSGFKVDVAMTLTAPGCGMGPAIAEDAKGKLLLVPGLSEADVRIVWEPTWNQSMISEEGKMKLGLI
jgi:probable FeS assembly SUF system protein SufT